MTVPGWLILNVYVLMLTGTMLYFSVREKRQTKQNKSFIRLQGVNLFLLLFDSFSRLEYMGLDTLQYFLARIGNYVIFAFDPIGYLFSILYVASWVKGSKPRAQKIFLGIAIAYAAINFSFVTLSEILKEPWFYTYTDGEYTRGSLFMIRGALNMAYCIVVEVYVLMYQKFIHPYYRRYIAAFPLIIMLAGFLQVMVSGAAYEYAGTAFASMVLYTYVQSRNLNVDYLTGILNRRGIDQELEASVFLGKDGKNFAAVMIDLDRFKEINDNFGHDVGDDALCNITNLICKSFGEKDRAGRFGGDEFLLILNKAKVEDLEEKLKALKANVAAFNQAGSTPYKLYYSTGYAMYGDEPELSPQEFLQKIDALMYKEKEKHHCDMKWQTI